MSLCQSSPHPVADVKGQVFGECLIGEARPEWYHTNYAALAMRRFGRQPMTGVHSLEEPDGFYFQDLHLEPGDPLIVTLDCDY